MTLRMTPLHASTTPLHACVRPVRAGYAAWLVLPAFVFIAGCAGHSNQPHPPATQPPLDQIVTDPGHPHASVYILQVDPPSRPVSTAPASRPDALDDTVDSLPVPPGLNPAQVAPLQGDALAKAQAERETALSVGQLPEVLSTAWENPPQAPEPPSAEARQLFIRGRQAYLEGQRFEAARHMLAAHRAAPQDPVILRTLGRVYTEAGNPVRGAVYLQQAAAYDADDLISIYLLGRHAMNRQAFPEAIALLSHVYDSATADTADDRTLRQLSGFFLGLAWRETGQLAAAKSQFQAFLDDDPVASGPDLITRDRLVLRSRRGLTRQTLGDLYLKLGQVAQAREVYDALQRDLDAGDEQPFADNALPMRRLYVALQLGNTAQAHALAQQEVRALTSDNANVVKALVQYLSDHTTDPQGLSEAIQRTRPAQDDPQLLSLWAAVVGPALTDTQAVDLLLIAVRDQPDDPALLSRLFTRWLEPGADGTVPYDAIAAEALRLVNTGAPIDALDVLLTNHTRHPDQLADALLKQPQADRTSVESRTLIAAMLKAADRPDQAREIYQTLLEDQPEYFPARRRLTGLALESGDINLALISIGPLGNVTTPEAIRLRVAVHVAAEQSMPALRLLREHVNPATSPLDLVRLRGRLEMRGGDPAAALETLNAALNRDETHEPTYALLFEIIASDPKFNDQNLPLFKRLRTNLPQATLTRLKTAQVHMERRNFRQAQLLIDAVLAEQPEHRGAAGLLVLLGVRTEQDDLIERGLKLLESETAPNVRVLAEAADYFFRTDREDRGIALRLAILMHQEPSPQRTRMMATLYHLQKSYAKVLETLDADRSVPDDLGDRITLAELRINALVKLDRVDEAIAAFAALQNNRAFTGATESGRTLWFSGLLDRAGRAEDSDRLLLGLLRKYPEFSNALNALAYRWAQSDRNLQAAEQAIGRALTLEPDNAAYLDTRGWVYYKQGRFDLAVRDIKQALDLVDQLEAMGASVPGTRAILLDHLADAQYQAGQADKALELWKAAATIDLSQDDSDDPEIEVVGDRINAKLKAVEAGQPVPTANVPGQGEDVMGPTLDALLKAQEKDAQAAGAFPKPRDLAALNGRLHLVRRIEIDLHEGDLAIKVNGLPIPGVLLWRAEQALGDMKQIGFAFDDLNMVVDIHQNRGGDDPVGLIVKVNKLRIEARDDQPMRLGLNHIQQLHVEDLQLHQAQPQAPFRVQFKQVTDVK